MKKREKIQFKTCKKNPRHIYSDHAADCPWCAARKRGLNEYFPDLPSSHGKPSPTFSVHRKKSEYHIRVRTSSLTWMLYAIMFSLCLFGVISIMNAGHNESLKSQTEEPVPVAQPQPADPIHVVNSISWGDIGSKEGELLSPGGVGIDSSGNLYVADTNNHRIAFFSSRGEYVPEWNIHGDTQKNINNPADITIDSSDFLYVVDGTKIKKFDRSGRYILEWGGSGNRNGLFSEIMGISIDKSNIVYILDKYSDSGKKSYRIQAFSSNGDFKWSRKIYGAKWLSEPQGFAVDNLNYFYISDGDINRVVKIDNTGGVVKNWGNYGIYSEFLERAGGLAVDSRSRVFVTDLQKNKFVIIANNGELEQVIEGTETGSVSGRKRIVFTEDNNVLILDRSNQPFTWYLGSDLHSFAPVIIPASSNPNDLGDVQDKSRISIYNIFSEHPTFSGYVEKPMTYQKWPITLRILKFDEDSGQVSGTMKWSTRGGETEIEGHITGNDFTFSETEYKKWGDMPLGSMYQVEKQGSTWAGVWNPPAKDRTGGGGKISFSQIS